MLNPIKWLLTRFTTYLDCAAKSVLAWMAASTSTVSLLSSARRIAWWICSFSGMMPATEPNVRNVSARAIGSFEWMTINTRFTNSSTLIIFSMCISLCWHTRSTHKRSKFEPTRKNSANLRNDELISMGNGYFSKIFGNRTIASHCSPIFGDRRPVNVSCIESLAMKSYVFWQLQLQFHNVRAFSECSEFIAYLCRVRWVRLLHPVVRLHSKRSHRMHSSWIPLNFPFFCSLLFLRSQRFVAFL